MRKICDNGYFLRLEIRLQEKIELCERIGKKVMMRIGYACLTVGVPNTELKTCLLKNASDEKLTELIKHNLNALEKMIDYNIDNQVELFRISSSLIPFGSNPVNRISWWEIFEKQLKKIGKKIASQSNCHIGRRDWGNTKKSSNRRIKSRRFGWRASV